MVFVCFTVLKKQHQFIWLESMIHVALFSFQRTPSLVLLVQYCVASSSPSVDICIMHVSVRFVDAPCLALKFRRDFRCLKSPSSVSQLLNNISKSLYCQALFNINFFVVQVIFSNHIVATTSIMITPY